MHPDEAGWFMKKHNYPLHIFLFLVTVFTTMMAGAELRSGNLFFGVVPPLEFSELHRGGLFSLCFLSFLTVHEFGHFFMALYHKVKTSLPFYIPIFLPFSMLNIGSFGAVIRIREMPGSRRKFFDIGVAGPLAGFVVSVTLLIIGFSSLPPLLDYVGDIHPEYLTNGRVPGLNQAVANARGYPVMAVGSNLLYDGMAMVFAMPAKLPPAHEMMHYPFLFVGFLTLFFTALNLLPIGQLDGGHVVYGLFGKKAHGYISRVAVLVLLFFGGTGLMEIPAWVPAQYGPYGEYLFWQGLKFFLYSGLLYLVMRRVGPKWQVWKRLLYALSLMAVQAGLKALFPEIESSGIWLLYAFLAVVMIGLDHPGAKDNQPLDLKRKFLGWLAILIFVLCFSIQPFLVL